MIYEVRWDARAIDDLYGLGKAEAVRIVKKVESHLVRAPLSIGKPLRAGLVGLYRYRIGDYRVLYEVRRNELAVIVVRIGHRKDVYDD